MLEIDKVPESTSTLPPKLFDPLPRTTIPAVDTLGFPAPDRVAGQGHRPDAGPVDRQRIGQREVAADSACSPGALLFPVRDQPADHLVWRTRPCPRSTRRRRPCGPPSPSPAACSGRRCRASARTGRASAPSASRRRTAVLVRRDEPLDVLAEHVRAVLLLQPVDQLAVAWIFGAA